MARGKNDTALGSLGSLDPEVLATVQVFSGTQQEMARPQAPIPLLTSHLHDPQPMAVQRVKTEYVTAIRVQKPRDLTAAVNAIINEARLAGASFFYYWEVWSREKGKMVPVEGPSIDLAMCFARNYGNCVVPIEQIAETPTHFTLKASFIDLESGFTLERLFRQAKQQRISEKMDEGRQKDIVFQIAQSKAQRNVITRAMPEWLKEHAMEEAKAAEKRRIRPENLQLTRQKVIEHFAQFGISKEAIEAHRRRPADDWTAEDIVQLRGMATAIREGRISPAQLFETRPVPENGPAGGAQSGESQEE